MQARVNAHGYTGMHLELSVLDTNWARRLKGDRTPARQAGSVIPVAPPPTTTSPEGAHAPPSGLR